MVILPVRLCLAVSRSAEVLHSVSQLIPHVLLLFHVFSGDDFPDVTLAESMMDAIKELREKSPKEEL